MSQTTAYGVALCIALLAAGVFLLIKGENVLGGSLIAAALAAAGLGKQAADASPPKVWIGAVLAGALLCGSAQAQTSPSITDVAARTHVSANGGAMYLTKGADWSGASLGGALTYNLHPQLSAFVGYDHGFPVNDVDEHLNLWRAVGSLRVHPNAFVGFGYAWFDKHTEGGLAQLVVTKKVMPRLAVGAVYAHIFSNGDSNDFEYARVYLNYHLLGKGS
jgi:hypothetical protein